MNIGWRIICEKESTKLVNTWMSHKHLTLKAISFIGRRFVLQNDYNRFVKFAVLNFDRLISFMVRAKRNLKISLLAIFYCMCILVHDTFKLLIRSFQSYF